MIESILDVIGHSNGRTKYISQVLPRFKKTKKPQTIQNVIDL